MVAFLCDRYRCTAQKMRFDYRLDYAFMQGRHIVFFAEVKDRPGLAFGFGDGYYISAQKVLMARYLTALTSLSCMLAIRCDDGLMRACDFRHHTQGAVWHGRNKPRDKDDKEPCCIFRWDNFYGFD